MTATDIKIPAALASECGGARHLSVTLGPEATLRDVFERIDHDHPRLGRRLRDEAGQLRRYINVYIGQDECRRLDGLDTPVADRPVHILPSIAGG